MSVEFQREEDAVRRQDARGCLVVRLRLQGVLCLEGQQPRAIGRVIDHDVQDQQKYQTSTRRSHILPGRCESDHVRRGL